MNSVLLPILFPLLMVIILLFAGKKWNAFYISQIGSILMLFIAVHLLLAVLQHEILHITLGGWEAPFGISLVIDRFSAIMLLTTSVLSGVICWYSKLFIEENLRKNRFYVFFFTLMMGINGALITADVFNLYVWFEVMLLSSFILLTMGRRKEQLEGGLKYLGLNLFGSLLFLTGLGLLYGKTGTLNMAHLASILQNDNSAILMNTSAMLFFIAFGIKAAIFPFFFWLPASYHTPNITISALFAGILTKVGVYVFIRFFTLFFVMDQDFWHPLLMAVSLLTMLVGGMAAAVFYDIRKILSFHIISQIGYMIFGLAVFTPLAIAGAIFFMVHNMVAKTNTFLIAGYIGRITKSYYLKDIGGVLKEYPVLAAAFLVSALSLAGIPPLSGFFAKYVLLKAGFEGAHYFAAGIAIITGILTLYSMVKIWNEAFLKKSPDAEKYESETKKLSIMDIMPSIVLAGISILIGVLASPVLDFLTKAGEYMIQPEMYIDAILK